MHCSLPVVSLQGYFYTSTSTSYPSYLGISLAVSKTDSEQGNPGIEEERLDRDLQRIVLPHQQSPTLRIPNPPPVCNSRTTNITTDSRQDVNHASSAVAG